MVKKLSLILLFFCIIGAGFFVTNNKAYALYADITSPPNQSTIVAPNLSLTWGNDGGESQWTIWVGSSAFTGNITSVTVPGNQSSYTFTNIPTNISPIHVTLWALFQGTWYQDTFDYQYNVAGAASMTTPASSGSWIANNNQAYFTWSTGTGVTQYSLWIGSSTGAHDYFQIYTTKTALFVGGLPRSGTIYVTLYSLINNTWYANQYTYTMVPAAIMTSPPTGLPLIGPNATFTWKAGGSGTSGYTVWISKTYAQADLDGSGTITATTYSVSNLTTISPSQLWVRLWTLYNGTWYWNDFMYWLYQPYVVQGSIKDSASGSGSNFANFGVNVCTWSFELNASQIATYYTDTNGNFNTNANTVPNIVGVGMHYCVEPPNPYTSNFYSPTPSPTNNTHSLNTSTNKNTPSTDASYENQNATSTNDCASSIGCNFTYTPIIRSYAILSTSGFPTTTDIGVPTNVQIQVQNTGNVTWGNTGPNDYALGSLNPQDNLQWGFNRVYLSRSVPPQSSDPVNSIYTFNFTIVPQAGGIFSSQWSMLQEGITWFYPPTAGVANPPGIVVLACDPSSSNSATCTNGNISNLNFGIINTPTPWYQGTSGDMRRDNGFSDTIPSSGNYASVAGSGGTPGLIFSGSFAPSFGSGGSSSTGWVVGGLTNAEVFTPTRPNIIHTSYNYLTSVAQENGLTPIAEISTKVSGCGNPSGCSLNNLPSGLWADTTDTDVYLNATTFCGDNGACNSKGPANSGNFVILIKGNLHILGNFKTPAGYTLTLSAKGTITVDKGIGESTLSSSATDIEGLISSDTNFTIQSTGNCSTEKRLNIAGSIVTNAGLAGGTIQNLRDFCNNDILYPTYSVIERPDFILNIPQFEMVKPSVWQEVTP